MATAEQIRRENNKSCKNSCCLLKRISGPGFCSGQGVLVRLDPATEVKFALLTCHHLIPSKKAINDWKVIYGDGNVLTIELKESMVSQFFTCCGNDGILGKEQHRDSDSTCPFRLDFSVIYLNIEQDNALNLKFVKLHNEWDIVSKVCKKSENDGHYKLKIYWRQVYKVISESYKATDIRWGGCWSWFQIPYRETIAEGASGSPGYVQNKSVIIPLGIRNEEQGENVCLACVTVPWIIKLLRAWKNVWNCDIKLMCDIYLLYEGEKHKSSEKSLLKKVVERLLSDPYFQGDEKELKEKVLTFCKFNDCYNSLIEHIFVYIDGGNLPSPLASIKSYAQLMLIIVIIGPGRDRQIMPTNTTSMDVHDNKIDIDNEESTSSTKIICPS